MKLITYLLLSIIFFASSNLKASDSLMLDFEQFISIVQNQHPITYQADLKISTANAKKLKAQGAFDPKIESSFKQKNFQEKNYYNNLNAALKVPAWYGLSFEAGYQQNTGDFINPQISTPTSGLAYSGVKLTVGNGFWIDQRRAELKQARIFTESSILEQKLLLNELYYEASKAYWKWFSSYHYVEIWEEALDNATKRFKVIRQNALLGEESLMDTLEAWIQVQNREIMLETEKLELIKNRNKLNIYLWQEGNIPLELNENARPIEVEFPSANTPKYLVDSMLTQHPKIGLLRNYVRTQDISILLAKEQLKPKIDLMYNPLFETSNSDFLNYNNENYKVGVSISYPLFTRKERGNFRLEKIKKEQIEMNLAMEMQKIKQSAISALNAWNTYEIQEDQYRSLNNNYSSLLKGEETLFLGGESSFFMVNSREKMLISTSKELVKIIQMKQESLAYYNYVLCNIE